MPITFLRQARHKPTNLKRAALGIMWKEIDQFQHSCTDGRTEMVIRKGFFDPEQFEAVRSRLNPDLQSVVGFSYITGWRIPSLVLTLQWREVDFLSGQVRLDPGISKNRAGCVFPFTVELRRILEEQRRRTDDVQRRRGIVCPWVFHRNGKPIKYFRGSWKTACKNAGLPGRIPHDFRRSAVRNLVRAGVPERVAMQMTNHKTRSVFERYNFERYNIVSDGDLISAAERLNKFSNPGVMSANGRV